MGPRHPRIARPRAGLLAALVLLPAVVLSACGVIGEDGTESRQDGPLEAGATIEALTGTNTAIKVDEQFKTFLKHLKVRAAATGGARIDDDGAIVFPITGGSVSLFDKGEVSPYVVGIVFHDGSGISLSKGDRQVTLSDLIVDPAFSRVYGDVAVNGTVSAHKALLFELDGRTLAEPDIGDRRVTLRGTKVSLGQAAADALDAVFNTEAAERGQLFGVATISVAQPATG